MRAGSTVERQSRFRIVWAKKPSVMTLPPAVGDALSYLSTFRQVRTTPGKTGPRQRVVWVPGRAPNHVGLNKEYAGIHETRSVVET